MKEMKKWLLALILMSCLAGAPAALAAETVASPGIFALFSEWLEALLAGPPAAQEGDAPAGGDAEIQAYIIPGG